MFLPIGKGKVPGQCHIQDPFQLFILFNYLKRIAVGIVTLISTFPLRIYHIRFIMSSKSCKLHAALSNALTPPPTPSTNPPLPKYRAHILTYDIGSRRQSVYPLLDVLLKGSIIPKNSLVNSR